MLNQKQHSINRLIFESNAHENTECSPISSSAESSFIN